MLTLPTTRKEIDELLSNRVPEDIHLDYKRSGAIDYVNRNEIAKDVSAFANSDGGLIIYGVEEQEHCPVRIDDGVDHRQYTREWLDQIIQSNITPPLSDVRIVQIPLSPDRSIYVVSIPKSFRGPHQAPSKHYYKRYNFRSAPMEDYEISDLRQRRRTVPALVNIDIQSSRGALIYLVVSNKGDAHAEDVTFQFQENFVWPGTIATPNIFTRGIKSLAPGKEFKFYYHQFTEVAKEGSSIPSLFDVTVDYTHSEQGQRITEVFHLDVLDFHNSAVTHSELYDTGERIRNELKNLTRQVEKLNNSLDQLGPLGDATGLCLSIPTLRNLGHLLRREDELEKINPAGCNYLVFLEVLGVDRQMALRLNNFFLDRNPEITIESLEGMTPELIERIRKHFIL